ncbi:MAG: bifunctional UDP-N-acetylglucosamine diphosphorylase/glucosamine-1-phosphate N-acetyltransferase GlmU [Pseudomonadota bacterium]
MTASNSPVNGSRELACVVLAAGKGTRMKSDRPKVLHELAGKPMLRHVLDTVALLKPSRTIAVIGPDMAAVAEAALPAISVEQPDQDGTGGATRAAMPELIGFEGDVLVLFGDAPMVTEAMLRDMLARRNADDDPAVVVMGVRLEDPAAFGRLVTDEGGSLSAIVEFRDADEKTRAINLCNGGLMALDGRRLPSLIDALTNDNAKGEYYVTDVVADAVARGWKAATVEVTGPPGLLGINSRSELAAAEAAMQDRLRESAMTAGATLIDPKTVYLSADTRLGQDVVIEPHVFLGPGVVLGDTVRVRAFSHLEGARVAVGAQVGPYARLRPGADIGEHARVGNFVEIKNAHLGEGAKASHLTYLGDAEIGARSNIGAGTITCNYDGVNKHRTVIGEDVFVGSNSALVAPVTIGDRANIAAGSTIGRDVEPDALGIARGRQENRPGWAKLYRKRLEKMKAERRDKG